MLTGPMTARRSDAENAYDLMSDIREYVLEEPKRVWMGDWLIKGHDKIKLYFDVKGPACGTVGCIAGNASVLAEIPWTNADHVLSGGNEALRRALVSMFYDTDVDARYGTKKYAQIVAKRIREFQKEHKDDLRAVQIQPVKPTKGKAK